MYKFGNGNNTEDDEKYLIKPQPSSEGSYCSSGIYRRKSLRFKGKP